MTTQTEAMKLALEALRTLHDENMDYLTRNKLGGENNQCMVFAREAITAVEKALAEQPAQQDIDWKDQYEKQKRRADMWVAKYEADIGPLEKAGPVAQPEQDPHDEVFIAYGLPKQEQSTTCGEPVAWMRQDCQRVVTANDRCNYPDYKTRYPIPLYTTPQPAQQKPVAEIVSDINGCLSTKWYEEWTPNQGDKLYTSPPPAQRTWAGLTDKHPLMVFTKECVLGAYRETELADAAQRAIEAAHDIKE